MHLCTCVSEEGGDREAPCPETPSLCTCVSEEGGYREAPCPETPSLLSYTLRYISFAEVGSVCRVALLEPMHLCTCVSEEGGDLCERFFFLEFLFFSLSSHRNSYIVFVFISRFNDS